MTRSPSRCRSAVERKPVVHDDGSGSTSAAAAVSATAAAPGCRSYVSPAAILGCHLRASFGTVLPVRRSRSSLRHQQDARAPVGGFALAR